MTTMHRDTFHGENAYHFKTGNHLSQVYHINSKQEAIYAFHDHCQSLSSSPYRRTDGNLKLSAQSQNFIDSLIK